MNGLFLEEDTPQGHNCRDGKVRTEQTSIGEEQQQQDQKMAKKC